MGSGALPLEVIPSAALIVRDPSLRPQELARRLRLGDPPVYVYVTDDAVHCNLRTVGDDEVSDLARALAAVLNAAEGLS
jgi:L-seryl-tRNA(Ser) seleniumtransferase